MRNNASWLAGGIAAVMSAGIITATVLASGGPALAPAGPGNGPGTPPPTPAAPAVPPSPATTTPPVAKTPPPPVVKTPPPAPTPDPRLANPNVPVAYPIPDRAALTASQLGDGFVVYSDAGDYPRTPTAMGQACDPGNPGVPGPISGRQWMFVKESAGDFQDTVVDQVVSGWPDGGKALAQLKKQTGPCVFPKSVRTVSSSEHEWAGTFTVNQLPYGVATVQVNNVLVSVTVTGPKGSSVDTAVAQARDLAKVAADRARAAGLDKR